MMDLLSITLAGTLGLAALLLSAHFLLKGWQGWLELKKLELASGRQQPRDDEPVASPAGGRIELADLKERVRKLEAIAAGIDL